MNLLKRFWNWLTGRGENLFIETDSDDFNRVSFKSAGTIGVKIKSTEKGKPRNIEDDSHERGPDLRGPAVVVVGGVLGGFEFYGPFKTVEDGCNWSQENTLAGKLGVTAGHHSVVLLKEPRTDVLQ